MKLIQGDLLQLAEDGVFDVIIHGCNCYCTMEAGIARGIRARFPQAYEADCQTVKGDMGKLGTISSARILRDGRELFVVNAYIQYDFTGADVLVDYDAVRSCMLEVKRLYSGKRIGYPKIGAGLAGGDWKKIAQIINEALYGEEHTLVEFKVAGK